VRHLLARPLQPQECFRFPLAQRWNQAPDLFFTLSDVGIDFRLVTQVEGDSAIDLLQRKSRELLLNGLRTLAAAKSVHERIQGYTRSRNVVPALTLLNVLGHAAPIIRPTSNSLLQDPKSENRTNSSRPTATLYCEEYRRISEFVERFAIVLVVDSAGSQDLFQRRPFHFVVIGNGDNPSGGADKNDVLSVFPAFKAELPLEYLTMLLPARKRQVE
jgi:hypothetical protein